MKRLLSTVGAGLKRWVGRESSTPHRPRELSSAEAEERVDRLIQLGYLKFVPEPLHAELRVQLIQTVADCYIDTDWNDHCVAADLRGYPADCEDLAEGQVGATILMMQSVLDQEGVQLDNVVDVLGDEKYDVVINGEPHLIYDFEGEGDCWIFSLKRLLEIVNGLLENVGSSERLFAIYDGHDGRAILLTEEMLDYIKSFDDAMDQDWMPRNSAEIGAGWDW